MASSKVYFTDLHTCQGSNLLQKMEKLLRKAGLDKMDLDGKMVAIKLHMGEPGNLAFVRPNFAAVLVRMIKEKGGRPFLTDCNTLYRGKRANAVDHLNAAMENGFNRIAVGCDVIIADGLWGNEQREIVIEKELCRTAKIGSAIADADVVISLSHFKGHELTGFGGALKNLGMGSGSRCGKMEMHASSHPTVNAKKCVGCGQCVKNCPEKAIVLNEKKRAVIDDDLCVGCGQCVAICRYGAPEVEMEGSSEIVNKKIAEYAYAVVDGKPSFHISLIVDVSPNCDCWPFNDVPIVPDIGIAASKDPVALDMACVSLVNEASVAKGSVLDVKGKKGDKFKAIHPNTDWMTGLDHAQRIGLGKKDYELVRLK
ncbi:MAG TPA: DUF362 domain-containing protein [Methanomassiliicoccales archaeon]|nr:DUF362 domain-containing protein [Methanomassiliicoccales archaeon]